MKSAASLFGLRAASDELLHLDLMRFVASCGIVFHHSHEYFYPPAAREGARQSTFGLALFVDLFFAISGFVIAYVYHDRIGSWHEYGRFLQRRVGRLAPLHWLTLAVSIILYCVFIAAARSHVKTMPSFNPLCIADTVLLLHSFVPCGNGTFFNGVSWSISVEMVMYVAFPIMALLGRKSPKVILGLATALLMTYLVYWHGGVFSSLEWTRISAPLRAIPSFLLGVGLFYNRKYIANIPKPEVLLLGSACALLGAMASNAPSAVILLGTYAVTICAVSADLQRRANAFVRAVAPLGQLTYSIYMVHAIFILVLMNVLGDKILHAGPKVMLVIAACCFVCIAVASYLSFRFIETPARRKIDNLRARDIVAIFV